MVHISKVISFFNPTLLNWGHLENWKSTASIEPYSFFSRIVGCRV